MHIWKQDTLRKNLAGQVPYVPEDLSALPYSRRPECYWKVAGECYYLEITIPTIQKYIETARQYRFINLIKTNYFNNCTT